MAAGWNKGKKWPAEVKQNIVEGLRVYYQTHDHFMHRPYHRVDCRCERCKQQQQQKTAATGTRTRDR